MGVNHADNGAAGFRFAPYAGAVAIASAHDTTTGFRLAPHCIALSADHADDCATGFSISPDAGTAVADADHATPGYGVRLPPDAIATFCIVTR